MPDVRVPFEDFVRARSAALFRFALLLTAHQDRSEAEDLLHEALERVYRNWPRICRSGDPERYVRRVLANASADRWRRLRRRPERPLTDDDSGPLAGDHASDVADRDFLLRALGGLARGSVRSSCCAISATCPRRRPLTFSVAAPAP